jgi:hypothetical protein
VTTTDLRLDGRSLIRGLFAAGEIDPHVVAAKVVEQADPETLAEFALLGAAYVARGEITALRHLRPNRQSTPNQLPAGGDGASRWRDAASHVGAGDVPYCVDRVWKRLRDCTRADVLVIVADYTGRADANRVLAERFTLLADTMRRKRASTVGALDEALLAEVLS